MMSRMRMRGLPIAAAVALPCLLAAGKASAGGQRAPTTETSIGIFYLPGAPEALDLWQGTDQGRQLNLHGRVLDSNGVPVSGALVELWHADASGGVDETRYRSAQRTKANGSFGIKTVLPGHIEMARDNPVFAPRHVHVMVTHPAHERLISLIFFHGDERLAGSPYPELAIVLERAREQDRELLFGSVELVLRSAGETR